MSKIDKDLKELEQKIDKHIKQAKIPYFLAYKPHNILSLFVNGYCTFVQDGIRLPDI